MLTHLLAKAKQSIFVIAANNSDSSKVCSCKHNSQKAITCKISSTKLSRHRTHRIMMKSPPFLGHEAPLLISRVMIGSARITLGERRCEHCYHRLSDVFISLCMRLMYFWLVPFFSSRTTGDAAETISRVKQPSTNDVFVAFNPHILLKRFCSFACCGTFMISQNTTAPALCVQLAAKV